MAVNTRDDEVDPDAQWYDLPPLCVVISPDELCLELEGLGKCLTMEVGFNRKKGEYFACYNFGARASRPTRTRWFALARWPWCSCSSQRSLSAHATRSWMLLRRRRCTMKCNPLGSPNVGI